MKKLLLLPALLLFAVACSTDSDELITSDTTTVDAFVAKAANSSGACYNNVTASVTNSGTFANPVWKFTPQIPMPVAGAQGFQVFLEYQATDCEDITVGMGLILSVNGGTFTNPNLIAPSVQAAPAQLLSCYRWRLKINGVSGKNYTAVNCTQCTPWYDAPLN